MLIQVVFHLLDNQEDIRYQVYDFGEGIMRFREMIRDIPDFPKKGILFRDITPLLANGLLYQQSIQTLAEFCTQCQAQMVVGPEARGYVIGAPLAVVTGCGFAPVRKKGKLPYKTRSASYALEYGEDTLEIHEDAIMQGQRVLVADDLLATGGTMSATIDLVQQLGGIVVGAAFLIELKELGGRQVLLDKIPQLPIQTLVQYD